MSTNSRVDQIQQIAFQERFKKINANTDTRTVWECIDRPIRPLIFELSRIGMIPKFSCCGYSYENEEEPKSHHGKFAYVFFWAPEKYLEIFNKLKQAVKLQHWNISYFNNHVWHLYIDNKVGDDLYAKIDGIAEAIHQYELFALSIESLTLVIQEYFPTVNDPVSIIDGNSFYTNIKNWIVRPKQPFTISVKDYYDTYGKLDINEWQKTAEDRIGVKLLTPQRIEELKKETVPF